MKEKQIKANGAFSYIEHSTHVFKGRIEKKGNSPCVLPPGLGNYFMVSLT